MPEPRTRPIPAGVYADWIEARRRATAEGAEDFDPKAVHKDLMKEAHPDRFGKKLDKKTERSQRRAERADPPRSGGEGT